MYICGVAAVPAEAGDHQQSGTAAQETDYASP
jgi:hypothetical protein